MDSFHDKEVFSILLCSFCMVFKFLLIGAHVEILELKGRKLKSIAGNVITGAYLYTFECGCVGAVADKKFLIFC